QAIATALTLPDESAAVWFSDPPYYFAVPYADISDFFFVWLKRFLPSESLLKSKLNGGTDLTPKEAEICEMAHWDVKRYGHKDKAFFEDGMAKSFSEARRILSTN